MALKSFKDLSFEDIDTIEKIDAVLKENLGTGLTECAEALCVSLKVRAEELSPDVINIAPYGKFEDLLENQDQITAFLRDEAAKPENWKLQYIDIKKDNDQLLEAVFMNTSCDEGESLSGYVFLGLSGKIRHCFPQVRG